MRELIQFGSETGEFVNGGPREVWQALALNGDDILMAIGGAFLPESPRWLVGTGKHDEALNVLRLLRRGAPDEIIEREWQLLIEAEREQEELHRATAWLDCFRGSNLRRTAIVVGVQCLQQAQGSSFIAN